MSVIRFHGFFYLFFLVIPVGACATIFEETYTIDVRVVDQDGEPVEGASVSGGFFVGSVYDPAAMQPSRSARGVTDRNGEARVSGPSLGSVDINVRKEGFYRSMKRMPMRGQKRHEVEMVLRDIRNPIPMYVKSASLVPPGPKGKYGYDLFVGDWVYEGHRGEEAHIFVEGKTHLIKEDIRSPNYEIEMSAEISFYGDLDGFQFADPGFGSVESTFKSMYEAPDNGFQEGFSIWWSRRLDSGYVRENINRPVYLRINSKEDEDGELYSANYCKVFPGVMILRRADRVGISMTYYCNPTPNDLNVEFDTQRNLFTDLRSDEQVGVP